jgi:phage terminase large subunit-like protein
LTTPPWLPAVYTQPLSEDYRSDGPRLREFVERFWKTEDGKPFHLDDWQADLIDRVLERYPDNHPDPNKAGRLRYRQVLISVARQNGKSVFAAIFGLYGLMMHEAGPTVIGLASNADQANIIYRRVKYVIDSHGVLKKRFKTTGTRGITRLDKPGMYMVKPAKADALQGFATTLCLFDEVHLCDPEMWQAMVKGTTAKDDGLVLGITTAGDDNSALLKDLYKTGRDAASGLEHLERFGFFCWEAPEGADIDDPDAIRAANPAVAAGRVPVERLQEQVRTEPESTALRYTHNRFVSAESAWLPMNLWYKAAGERPVGGKPVFAIDRTPGWEHAVITANIKTEAGIFTKVIASINKPSVEQLLDICIRLQKHNPIKYVMDGYTLSDLAKELERRGMPTKVMRQSDVTNACATSYALIARGKVTHADDELLRRQMPFAVKKNVGDAWRINRAASSVDIDAVMSTVFGIYSAEIEKDAGMQLL